MNWIPALVVCSRMVPRPAGPFFLRNSVGKVAAKWPRSGSPSTGAAKRHYWLLRPRAARLSSGRIAMAERSAARLAHQSGGLGVPSSNLGAPTNKPLLYNGFSPRDYMAVQPINGTKRNQNPGSGPESPGESTGAFRTCSDGSELGSQKGFAWTSRLSRVVRMKDGAIFKTLADARAYFLAIEDGREERNHWQSAAEKRGVEAATIQIELALLKEGRLVP